MHSPKTRRVTDYLIYLRQPVSIRLENTGVRANAILNNKDGTVQVLLKSEIRLDDTNSIRRDAAQLRQDLIKDGVVQFGSKNGIFVRSYTFGNPSQASNVILGSCTTGMAQWFETTTNRSLGDYLEHIKAVSKDHWRSRADDLTILAQPSTLLNFELLKKMAEEASQTDQMIGINISLYRKK